MGCAAYVRKGEWLLIVIATWLLLAAHPSAANPNITDRDIADAANTADWLAYGRTHDEQRFSPLKDINANNVNKLGVAWYMDLPNDVGLVSTPLVIDGIMYFTGTMNIVRAVNARNGKLIWEYDPEVAKVVAGRKKVGWVHNRGLSAYGDKIFAATWDGRLIALELKTGKLVWSARTFDLSQSFYITGPPKAFKGKVLIGNGGTETGPARGYVTAYDANSGKQVWRFYVVPGNPADGFENPAMEMAAKTWNGKWWEHGGGGNVWNALTYDAELDTIYIGTGNGSPWNREIRSPGGGDNLFLCSIVALDPDTGDYKWHYQTTPGEQWDYNSSMDMVLADLDIDGKPIKALLHAPKNGFFYVLDRRTGKLVSAQPFADVNWATHIDHATGRPVERPGARYENGAADIYPSPIGAHSWHAMSFNPQTGLVYLPTLHLATKFAAKGYGSDWKSVPFEGGTAVDFSFIASPYKYPGSLQAWDPVEQRAVWTVDQESFWASGTLTTAGNLVFQGDAEGFLKAYNATTGKELWSVNAGLGISAPAITYKLNGKQMISVLVGFGGGYASGVPEGADQHGWAYGVHARRLLTFALGGKVDMPAQPGPIYAKPVLDKNFKLDPALAAKGEKLWYGKQCGNCHGIGAVAGGMAPDLRASALPMSKMEALFTAVVRDGQRVARGMPGFPDIKDVELQALRHYIRKMAHDSLNK